MIVLHVSMQGEDIIKHIKIYNLVYKRKMFLRILMPSVICVYFSQLMSNCVTLNMVIVKTSLGM
jgi:hypothetical protein